MVKKKYTYFGDVRIQNISDTNKNHLKIICEKLGISSREFIKSQLPYIIEKFYQEFPESRPQKKDPE